MDALSIGNALEAKKNEIYDKIEAIARENMKEAMTNEAYTTPQKMAILKFHMLNLTGDLDLPPLMVRGKILEEIHNMKLWSQLPGSYSTEEEAIEAEANMSRTEAIRTRDLYTVVFPFVQNKMGLSIPEFWASARSKSNIFDLVPLMKVAITGELSRSEGVNEAVKRIKEEVGDDTEKMVDHMIDLAGTVSNRNLRDVIRPTDKIAAVLARRNGTTYMLAELTNDEADRIRNMKGFEVSEVSLEEYEVKQIPVARRLIGE